MRIDAIDMKNQSQLMIDYRNNEKINDFFDYEPFGSLEARVKELKSRTFQREALADILTACNRKWGAGTATMEAIQQITDPNSVVVVGGQQAGLLTGPLYTVNKIISILQYAKKQESELGVPVLPVFWIAGEDHDYEEINHIYLPEEEQLKKYKINQPAFKKTPISEMEIDQVIGQEWLDELFTSLRETMHTKDVYERVVDALKRSKTFTDFFAHLIHDLFQTEGIILIDAQDPKVRDLEKDYFIALIENQPKISQGVFEAVKEIKALGYPPALEVEQAEAHLFYHVDGERILLYRTEDGMWKGKMDEVELSTEELFATVKNTPEKLSNNVVTRPLMQELLLPTLAFIGGPGEISYWALLKPAFHALEIKMPPVVPRLSITYVPTEVNKALETTKIPISTAVNEGSKSAKEAWILDIQEPPIATLAEDVKRTLKEAHQPLQQVAQDIRADVGALADKNLEILLREIEYLQNRMERTLEQKHEKIIEPFDQIEQFLHPNHGLQERVWNILPFINAYGVDFLSELSRTSISFEEAHYVVYL